jgi:O-antigen/teichoic acid export membrane protein
MSIFPTITATYIKEKWQHAGFQKYFRNMGWAFSGKITSLILSFFIGALVARYLGPERYGVLNYALSFVTIFVFLSSFGIDNILVRDLIKNKEESEVIINTSFSIKLIGGILVIFISTLSSLIFNDFYTTLLIFLYSLHLLFGSLGVLDSYFQSVLKYKYGFIGQFVSVIIVSIFKLFLIYNKFGTGWFILAIVLDTFFAYSIIYFIYRKQGKRLRLNLNLNIAKKMIADSWPFILTGAFFLIYTKIDQIMIGKMIDTASLGVYSAGVKLSEIWYFIPTIICGVLFPSIINSKNTNENLYKKRIKKLFYLIIPISFFIALFEFIFAKYLILFIFGQAYLGSVIVLQVYTWAGIIVSIILVAQQYLTVENKTKLIMFSSLIGAVANIILNIFLIPKYGILGAAFATLISYSLIPMIIYFSKEKNVTPY